MKILALSDIDGNVAAVRKLRHQEENEFDAVVVAGDIGNEGADQIFEVLSTFDCPVLYVYGNHDYKLGYDRSFGKYCTHLHMNIFECGDVAFAGFSGCPANWGRNPIATKLMNELYQEHRTMFDQHACLGEGADSRDRREEYTIEELLVGYIRKIRPNKVYKRFEQDWKRAGKEALALNRQALFDHIRSSGVNPERVVVVAHERLARLDENIHGIHCHLFGHRHGFDYNLYRGTHCVNVSVLNRLLTVYPKDEGITRENRRNVNAGNYAIIETDGANQFTASCKDLRFDPTNWEIEQNTAHGPAWLPGEEAFA